MAPNHNSSNNLIRGVDIQEYFFFFFKSSIYYTGRNGSLWQVQSTYLNTEEKRSNKKGKGKGKWKGKMLRFYLGELRRNDISTIVKAECARVVHKEVDKAVYDDIAWTCGWVICITLHDDMFSCLDFSFATWAADGVTVVPWTSSHILYGLPLHQKGDVSKATC